MTPAADPTRDLRRFAWLSIAAAIATITLKAGAWLLTGSVGLLSDAAESIVNLVAAVVALVALTVAGRPADDDHHFGHAKAEYFSAAVEGLMIFVAAAVILVTAVERFLHPQPIDNVGVGLAVSVVASVINGLVAMVLVRAGRKHDSITLRADGQHLLTDVWTSVGVVAGVLLVALTGWQRLDPIVAFLVGINIVLTGVRLLRESVGGLMDTALPEERHREIASALLPFASEEVDFHGLRTRKSGHHEFAELHLLVPGHWTVRRGHDLTEDVEQRLRATMPELRVVIHLEPLEDPRSYDGMPVDLPELLEEPGRRTDLGRERFV
ncbi:cation diffusion facilitator family transporter [Arsenicicoccus bolidensis]|uniref:Cation diffusion facilitator family transporter n=1 Tax=Arsenicicoccus bolidensis TaxID=229480 RepID=A0ABS9Q144_9MICO|nr:cation diffusion facilitator family transporter [Arsenicicoccus bolidensis]MCG7321595.1 cation diffusion facilitator family transporter [Arsenicicoccus bolidensis]